jgi:hypothetical protein
MPPTRVLSHAQQSHLFKGLMTVRRLQAARKAAGEEGGGTGSETADPR